MGAGGNKSFALGRLKVGVMNGTEAEYARELETLRMAGDVAWYKFEGVKLRLADNTFYTPDFAVMLANGEMQMHEVKGAAAIFQDDAKVKVKVASSLYPFRFYVLFPRRKRDGGGFESVEY